MKRDLFRRYVWLIDTVRHARKIQFEGITERWMESPLNADHSQLALRTFHTHRHAIENLFGIRIICDRTDNNQYYIADWPNQNVTKLKMWMLQKLSFSDIDEETEPVGHRILLDPLPEEKYGLPNVIEAIQNNRVLRLSCSVPTSDNKTSLLLAPYCIRYWRSQWYIFGKDVETSMLHAFNLERVIEISPTDATFEYPRDFSPEVFFRDFFGMDVDSTRLPEVVRLKICGRTRDMAHTLPLHRSQKEVISAQDYSVFEYFIVPTEEFQNTILSHCTDTEVLFPESLRADVAKKVNEMARRYNTPEYQTEGEAL